MTDFSTTQPAGSPTGACPTDCAEAYALVRQEPDATARLPPIERNQRINAAYDQLARDMPENDWVRLASYVSVQGGCAMAATQRWPATANGTRIFFFDSQEALQALGEANQAIFENIYPANRMVANCGYEKFLQCVESGEIQAPPELVNAIKQMQNGQGREAADTIANYEQRQVVQPVYERHPETFAGMRSAAGFADFFGSDQASIPIAKECTRDNLVRLDGDITNPSDRVDYYHQLLERMYEIEGAR